MVVERYSRCGETGCSLAFGPAVRLLRSLGVGWVEAAFLRRVSEIALVKFVVVDAWVLGLFWLLCLRSCVAHGVVAGSVVGTSSLGGHEVGEG